MKALKNAYPASSAVRLSESLTITESQAGTDGTLTLSIPNAGVYTPDGKSLELWLLRDGAGMRVFAFDEISAREIQIDRSVLSLRENDVLEFIEYFGYVDQDEENTEKMLGLEVEMARLKEEMQALIEDKSGIDEYIPLGFAYTQFADSPLPGDTLLDNDEEDITADFDSEQLSSCMYSGTTWKLAVRAGDFLRQLGTRTNEDGLELGTSTLGESQEDQFQGHKFEMTFYSSGPGGGNIDGSYCSGVTANTNGAQSNSFTEIISDDSNGTPRTGAETRPVNTAVCFWVRVA